MTPCKVMLRTVPGTWRVLVNAPGSITSPRPCRCTHSEVCHHHPPLPTLATLLELALLLPPELKPPGLKTR